MFYIVMKAAPRILKAIAGEVSVKRENVFSHTVIVFIDSACLLFPTQKKEQKYVYIIKFNVITAWQTRKPS